jgi:hypothetical protein
VIECVVDANEPPMPGKITTEQALNFAKSLLHGEKNRWDIIKSVLADKVREVIEVGVRWVRRRQSNCGWRARIQASISAVKVCTV